MTRSSKAPNETLQFEMVLCFRPKNNPSVTFGICVPAVCSMGFLEDFVQNQVYNEKIPFNLLDGFCQLEENPYSLTILDWMTM